MPLLDANGQAVDKLKAIDEIFSKYHEYEGFQGTVLVAERGKVIYREAFGLANREWNIPNQVDSRFDIASVSKQFTAMLVMQLYEEGKIHLDSTISSYYPEYRSDVARNVTVHHLLTHRSGIPNYTSIPYVWSDSLINRYSSDELVQKFCSGELEFEPGSRYSYNNSGYFILSVILEKVSGQSFAELLQEKILEPLHMSNTGVDQRSSVIDKRAYGYVQKNGIFENARPMYMANLQGAGNMYSTVDDLYRWDRALHARKLLSAKGHREMTQAFSEENDTWITPYKNSYGYGMGVAKVPGPRNKEVEMVFHSGHITGYSSFMARFVDDEHLVVLLSNLGEVSTARMNAIAQEVKNVLYGLPYEVPKRSLKSSLFDTIRSEGIEAGLEQYDELTEAFPYEYKDTGKELYQLGKELLASNMEDEALEIYRLNVKVNPNWKSYHLLADAYYEREGYQEAALLYKKSMEINPRSTQEEKTAFQAARKSLSSLNQ
jgi:CubicO group peptidase (beta-lactamase class C family)